MEKKAIDCQDLVKAGRTHLMDAVPITLAQEISAWQAQLADNRQWLTKVLGDPLHLPLGGTAVVEVALELTDLPEPELRALLDPKKLDSGKPVGGAEIRGVFFCER